MTYTWTESCFYRCCTRRKLTRVVSSNMDSAVCLMAESIAHIAKHLESRQALCRRTGGHSLTGNTEYVAARLSFSLAIAEPSCSQQRLLCLLLSWKWTTKMVRFPTAKESWKACVFVGNLNIWGSCKIALILGFPCNFLLQQKWCAWPHSCHFAVAFRWCSLYPTLPPLTSGCVFIHFIVLAMWLWQLRLLFFFS